MATNILISNSKIYEACILNMTIHRHIVKLVSIVSFVFNNDINANQSIRNVFLNMRP